MGIFIVNISIVYKSCSIMVRVLVVYVKGPLFVKIRLISI